MSEKEKLMYVKNTVYTVILISKSILLINHTNTFVMSQKDRRHGMNMINVLNSTILFQLYHKYRQGKPTVIVIVDLLLSY